MTNVKETTCIHVNVLSTTTTGYSIHIGAVHHCLLSAMTVSTLLPSQDQCAMCTGMQCVVCVMLEVGEADL